MFSSRARSPIPLLPKLLLWWIVIALAVQGSAAAVVQMLGPYHRHEAASHSASSNVLVRIDEIFHDIRAWRDELRQRLLPSHLAHVHADGVVHSHHDHDREHFRSVGTSATADRSPAHEHSIFQRHHHSLSDSTVVAIESSVGDPVVDAASQAGAGSATLPLAVAFAWHMPLPPWRPMSWPLVSTQRWADAPDKGLERPPRA